MSVRTEDVRPFTIDVPEHELLARAFTGNPGGLSRDDELYPAPQSWAERAYPKLVHDNRVAEGGHFAAWEQPQTPSEEVRATFRSLR